MLETLEIKPFNPEKKEMEFVDRADEFFSEISYLAAC